MRSTVALGALASLLLAAPAVCQGGDLVLVVLRAPTPPKPLDAARSQQLMAAHMANINRLVKEETMLFAGPLVQSKQTMDERGIFMLDVPTLEQARAVVATDPAVAAGVFDAHLSTFVTPDPLRRVLELERAARQAQRARGEPAKIEMRVWTMANAKAGAATTAAVAKLRDRDAVAFAGTASNGPDAGVWIVLDAADPTAAQTHLDAVGGDVEWLLRPWYGSVHLDQVPRLAVRDDAPSFEILAIGKQGRFAAFHGTFARRIDVFGVQALATADVPHRKLLHAAHVMAQYLDNDEDGMVDDPKAHAVLVKGGAHLVMAATERDFHDLDPDWEALEGAGFRIGQDLYGEETLPAGPPHVRARGRFDASLEEVWHLVSNGWEIAYPDDFGYRPGSRLCDAMDLARGGRFLRMPRRYPDKAWYHYDDRTCDYRCMAAEYFYWSLTTLLGGQDYPGRAREIEHEWECPTPESLARRDAAVHALLSDPRRALPRVLPDGSYGQ